MIKNISTLPDKSTLPPDSEELSIKNLYVLTRSDLNLPYRAVQGAHAVAQFLIDYPNTDWNNNYLIFLQVNNKEALDYWIWRIDKNIPDEPSSVFREPDLNNELTAIAVYTNSKMFNKLELMNN